MGHYIALRFRQVQGWVMPSDRDRFNKVVAVAISPGAYEGEAIAALHKARELVKKDPSLAHPPAVTAPPHDTLYEAKITDIPPSWLNVALTNLSLEAYGPKKACEVFSAHVKWVLNYINSQPPKF
jgi:hypothetical protein